MNNKNWMYHLFAFGLVFILINGCKKDDNSASNELKDMDGNVYHPITIGTQTWMVENLKTTKYNDGTSIQLVTENAEWYALSTPGYCWYNNKEANYKGTYGALYNWYTVNTGKLCPAGWHVPSDAEWTVLIDFLGGDSIAGGKLKEEGLAHWNDPNTGATNESGFTALPSGSRYIDGDFDGIGDVGYWWSSTEILTYDAWYREVRYNGSGAGSWYWRGKTDGFPVRCLCNE